MQVSRINHWNHGWHILKWRSSSQERWRPRLASHTASRGWCTRKQEFVSVHRAKTLITWNDILVQLCCMVFWQQRFILVLHISSYYSSLFLLILFGLCFIYYIVGIINWIYPINVCSYYPSNTDYKLTTLPDY